MSEAAAAVHDSPIKPDVHFGTASHGKLGMWIFLLTDGMSFAGLLIALAVLRAGAPLWPPRPEHDHLGIPFTALMTFVLICSSVTMVMALAAGQKGDRNGLVKWLAATVGGGLFFLCGQVYEYSHLIEHGMSLGGFGAASAGAMRGDAFSWTFFIVTGFHGAHVTTGVIYLSIATIKSMKAKLDWHHNNFVEIAGLFWHFVDLVWILVFTFIYLIPTPQTYVYKHPNGACEISQLDPGEMKERGDKVESLADFKTPQEAEGELHAKVKAGTCKPEGEEK